MIDTVSSLLKPFQRMIILRMIAECEGRIAFNQRQINRDKAKLAEIYSKQSLNFLKSQDMVEREGRIQFNQRQLERDKANLELLKERLRKLQG